MKTIKYRRTSEIKLTKEALLLRELRLGAGLSLRETGRRLDCSESFVRHIEKGRLDFPNEDNLRKILFIYNVSLRQFKKKIKSEHIKEDPKNEINRILNYLDENRLEMVLKILKGITGAVDENI
jgi:transcriptional regulator with XRE-family HTH domain